MKHISHHEKQHFGKRCQGTSDLPCWPWLLYCGRTSVAVTSTQSFLLLTHLLLTIWLRSHRNGGWCRWAAGCWAALFGGGRAGATAAAAAGAAVPASALDVELTRSIGPLFYQLTYTAMDVVHACACSGSRPAWVSSWGKWGWSQGPLFLTPSHFSRAERQQQKRNHARVHRGSCFFVCTHCAQVGDDEQLKVGGWYRYSKAMHGLHEKSEVLSLQMESRRKPQATCRRSVTILAGALR